MFSIGFCICGIDVEGGPNRNNYLAQKEVKIKGADDSMFESECLKDVSFNMECQRIYLNIKRVIESIL